MTATRPRLPQLSTLQAKYVCALAQLGGTFDITLPPALGDGTEPSTQWRLTCQPRKSKSNAPPIKDSIVRQVSDDTSLWLGFQWGGCAYALLLPDATVNVWTKARFPGLDLLALPAEWHRSANALLTQSVMSALRTVDPDVLPITPVDASQWAHCWDVSVQSRTLALEAMVGLYMGHDGLNFLTEQLAAFPAEPSMALRDIPIVLSALIGRTDLSVEHIRTLCVGDVVLLDHAIDIHTDEHWLATDSGDAFCIRPCPQGGSVTQPWKHCMSLSLSPLAGVHGAEPNTANRSPAQADIAPYDTPPAEASDPRYDESYNDPYNDPYDDPYPRSAAPPDVEMGRIEEVEADEPQAEWGDLTHPETSPPNGLAMSGMGSGYALLSEQGMPLDPRHIGVQLVFDVGEYRVPLCDLLALKTGSIINLGQTFSTRTVRIRSAGRAIGEGELVDVEGRVGVRITRWCAESP